MISWVHSAEFWNCIYLVFKVSGTGVGKLVETDVLCRMKRSVRKV